MALFSVAADKAPMYCAPPASSGTITAGMSSFRRKGLVNLTQGEIAHVKARAAGFMLKNGGAGTM